MFFLLSKLLGFLTSPLAMGLLFLASGSVLVRWRRRLGRGLLIGGFCVIYLFSLGRVADLLLLPLERPFTNPSAEGDFQAIVVLAGMVDLARSSAEHIELKDSADRLTEGILLARSLPGSLLIFTGGSGDPLQQDRKEAISKPFQCDGWRSSSVSLNTASESIPYLAILTKTRSKRRRFCARKG